MSRARISFSTSPAICARDPVSFMEAMNSYASFTVMPVTSMMGFSLTNTARDSGRRRVPWHVAHGMARKNCS